MINYILSLLNFFYNDNIILIMTRIFFILSFSKIFYIKIDKKINIFFVFFLSNLLLPLIKNVNFITEIDFFIELIKQLILGLFFGFLIQSFFSCINYVGGIISSQLGLSFSFFLDPRFRTQTLYLSRFLDVLSYFLFFVTNGPMLIIKIVFKSFELFPLGCSFYNFNFLYSLIYFSRLIFFNAIFLSCSVMVFLLILQIIYSFLTRFIVQLPLLSIIFSASFILGMFFFRLWINVFSFYFIDLLNQFFDFFFENENLFFYILN